MTHLSIHHPLRSVLVGALVLAGCAVPTEAPPDGPASPSGGKADGFRTVDEAPLVMQPIDFKDGQISRTFEEDSDDMAFRFEVTRPQEARFATKPQRSPGQAFDDLAATSRSNRHQVTLYRCDGDACDDSTLDVWAPVAGSDWRNASSWAEVTARVDAGTYALHVQRDELNEDTFLIDIEILSRGSDDVASVDVEMRVLAVDRDDEGNIYGSRDASNLRVRLDGAEGFTDEDGVVTLSGIRPGTHIPRFGPRGEGRRLVQKVSFWGNKSWAEGTNADPIEIEPSADGVQVLEDSLVVDEEDYDDWRNEEAAR